jgi:DNA-binding protein HU-beta
MNKGELIDAIAAQSGLTKTATTTFLNSFVATVQNTVVNGEKVVIMGFGAFEKRDRVARKGYNPKTGESLNIPATAVPVFSAGKAFKEAVADNG